jgi:hypothetical protein
MNPAWIRYPAGTQGNQWNWKTGTFIASLGANAREIFTIPMLVKGLPSNTKIIYMVNMVLPTEQTGITFSTTADTHLATDATLTAKITDILNALAEFAKAGRLPEVCELGNELYFTNEHAGVYANKPTFYLQHAKIIAQAIKSNYPAMKIILCTTKGGTSSRDAWNNTVFNALISDNQLRALVYGVVQHHYINDKYGILTAVNSTATAKTIIDEGIQYVQEIPTDYAVVPSSMKLWITEYGATKPSADGMWASGMRLATMTLSFMKMGPKVDNLMWHHITDDPNILNSIKNKLGPSGIAFAMLSKAMNGATQYRKLVFSTMSPTDVYAGLTGYKFSTDGEERILILNTTSTTYNGVDLSTLTGNGTLSYANQYWSSTPYQTDVSTSNGILQNTSENLASYQINPFSITVFRKLLNTDITFTGNDITKIYPGIISLELNIEVQNAEKYKISDIAGREISSGTLMPGKNELKFSEFVKGVNFITINSKTYKVIRN